MFAFSCLDLLDPKDKPQVYPNTDYKNVKSIILYNYIANKVKILNDEKQTAVFKTFFQDSSNYFKTELRKFNGVKPIYRIDLISNSDTLLFKVYPTITKSKIEIDFMEPYDPENKWKSRKVHRFYLNDELTKLIDNSIK